MSEARSDPAGSDAIAVEGSTAAPIAAPVIVARRLTKRYGRLVAVDELELDVRAGEIYGLLGPNGAGKTTTVLMLRGLSEPTSGEVRVLGLDPTRDPRAVKRQVGYLPDNAGFYGSLTGRQNLRYTARLNGLTGRAAETRIGDVLDEVGLTDRADDRVEAYSRGMRQRLGIADALVKSPRVLILDEPTTAIDPIGVTEILELIRRLARDEGLAILLASHLLDQVQAVCRRVGIFDRGRLVGEGTVGELATEFGDGTNGIELGVDAFGSSFDGDIGALLAAVPGVAVVESLESDGRGLGGWSLTLADAADPRVVGRAVIDRVFEAELTLDRFGQGRPSLERIYRRAVERAAASDGADGDGRIRGVA